MPGGHGGGLVLFALIGVGLLVAAIAIRRRPRGRFWVRRRVHLVWHYGPPASAEVHEISDPSSPTRTIRLEPHPDATGTQTIEELDQ